MTMLSWALYALEVIDSLGTFMLFLSLMGFSVIVVYLIGWVALCDVHKESFWPVPHLKKAVSIVLLISLTSTLLPSKDTMYKIAAIEVGNVVVQTPEAQKVKNLLIETITTKLGNLTKGSSND